MSNSHYARRGQWHDDELMVRYGGGGYEREEPDWGKGTETRIAKDEAEREEQRMLLAKNADRIAKIKAKAAAGRTANRADILGASRGKHEWGKDLTRVTTEATAPATAAKPATATAAP